MTPYVYNLMLSPYYQSYKSIYHNCMIILSPHGLPTPPLRLGLIDTNMGTMNRPRRPVL